MYRLIRGIIGFTVIEALTLIAWLALTGVDPVAAIVVLFVGLGAEHFVSSRVRRGSVAEGPLVLVTAVETATWAGWLAIGPSGPAALIAAIVLVLGLNVGHVLEANMLRKQPVFSDFGRGFLGALTVITTGIETLIGSVWFGTGNILVLAGGLLIEHVIATFGRGRAGN